MDDRRGLGDADADGYRAWVDHGVLGQGHRSTNFAGTRVGPNRYPPFGLSLLELSEAQRLFTNYARMRLVGATEYDRESEQSFERMEPQRILLELRQEVADAVNYLTFLDIQLARWGQRLESVS